MNLMVFARGLLHRLLTRAYLPLSPGVTDPVLTSAGDRAGTLVSLKIPKVPADAPDARR